VLALLAAAKNHELRGLREKLKTMGALQGRVQDLENELLQLENVNGRSRSADLVDLDSDSQVCGLREERDRLRTELEESREQIKILLRDIESLKSHNGNRAAHTSTSDEVKLSEAQATEFSTLVETLKQRVKSATALVESPGKNVNTTKLQQSIYDATQLLDCKLHENMSTFDALQQIMNRLFEDMGELIGAVQVFIRMRSVVPTEKDIQDARKNKKPGPKSDKDIVGCITYSSDLGTLKVRGEEGREHVFKDMPIYDPVSFPTNTEVYTTKAKNQNTSISDIVLRVMRGNNVVLLSFGVSGAGKSYLMMNRDDGILPRSLKMLKEKGLSFRVLIFEEYLHKFASDSKGWAVSSQVIPLVGKLPASLAGRINKDAASRVKPPFNLGKDKFEEASEILGLLDDVEKRRIGDLRISPTKNNDKSSRSHLYIIIQCVDCNNNVKGVLQVVDMAGVESPNVLYDSMAYLDMNKANGMMEGSTPKIFIEREKLKKIHTPGRDQQDWHTEVLTNPSLTLTRNGIVRLRDVSMQMELSQKEKSELTAKDYNSAYVAKIEADVKKLNYPKNRIFKGYVYRTLCEGFFINESLNEMREFLVAKRGGTLPVRKRQSSSLDLYDVNAFFNEPTSNPPLMHTRAILEYLDNPLSKGDAKTKWVVIVNIRPQPEYCNDTMASMEFAEGISAVDLPSKTKPLNIN
jgi:hypothetical protein